MSGTICLQQSLTVIAGAVVSGIAVVVGGGVSLTCTQQVVLLRFGQRKRTIRHLLLP